MDIEVIENYHNKLKKVIIETLIAYGVTPSHNVVEEFLSYYYYNGLTATINNLFDYCGTVTHCHEEKRQLRFVTQR